jgi:hypothetical protein
MLSMTTPRTRTFNQTLRAVLRPVLDRHGFVFDRGRAFRNIDPGRGAVQIVHFQLGQRSLAGKFTVNLGVLKRGDSAEVGLEKAYPYHCPCGANTRLGHLLPATAPVLSKLPLLGFLFASRDRWWRFSDDEAFTSRQLVLVTDLIVAHGLPWLQERMPSQSG